MGCHCLLLMSINFSISYPFLESYRNRQTCVWVLTPTSPQQHGLDSFFIWTVWMMIAALHCGYAYCLCNAHRTQAQCLAFCRCSGYTSIATATFSVFVLLLSKLLSHVSGCRHTVFFHLRPVRYRYISLSSLEVPKIALKLNLVIGISPVVHWLRLCLPMQGVSLQFLVQGLRSHMTYDQKNQTIKQKQYCNKFNKDF